MRAQVTYGIICHVEKIIADAMHYVHPWDFQNGTPLIGIPFESRAYLLRPPFGAGRLGASYLCVTSTFLGTFDF